MAKEIKVILGIGLIVVVGGILLFTSQPKPVDPGKPVDTKSLIRDNSHMTGNKDAKVTIVEFGDYECPACAKVAPVISRIREEYKNNADVNFVYRHFPLPQHGKAFVSAEAAEAAGEQGKFWEMTDKLYATQEQWIRTGDHKAVLGTIAKELGLDAAKFEQTWQQNKYHEVIRTDQTDGESLGVNSTPTFFINGEKYSGDFTYDDFKKAIDQKLK